MKSKSTKYFGVNIPDFITHYSRGEPFRSFTSIPQEKWREVIKEMDETNAWGLGRFSDSEYLVRRLTVEKRMREELLEKGGTPELDHPIYFFLGRNSRFEEHEKNFGYTVQLKDLDPKVLSFTYGDSMFVFNEDYRLQQGVNYQSNLCQKIYLLHELADLMSHPKFSSDSPLHIEAQLWIHPPKEVVSVLRDSSDLRPAT